ncbi:TonB-dependent outer membrane protein, SusC/RagA [Gemmatirosa kalamazoonensis]|uniref:TonB-dependent outer membrane protein, SusC/RagA n=1 Tax=Gemmatirosa kalamazoonensis TaxID=861299 RepID=W0RIR0_9BACT|nr:SusC/RagA family TonB-linked outer membrane protein [Gemmatirosa kalamazoonensis]AHG90200.1 TonB-dependent outer membrane protein, SusC/RagA [Gemmatirosa kalamazoonensis]
MSRIRFLLVTLACLALSATSASAQVRRVTGVITATGSGEPLSAASVQVVGTTTGTYTNEQGRFSISVPAGSQQLRVRRIGYLAKVVPVTANQTDVTVTLDKDVLQLETQVVTGTATSVARANAANAVSQVTAEQLTRAPAQTLDNALQGKIAGATITVNSGAPGGGSQVQLRGVTSINATSSPLYVVDGVIVSNQSFGIGLNSITNAGGGISTSQDQQVNRTADLNPEDIESIEVLKGPAAGAIYGSKASNGVIVIRTKRGANGRTQFSATQRLGTYQLQGNRKLGIRCFSSQQEAEDWYGGALPAPYDPTCHDFESEFYKPDGPSYQTALSLRGGTNTGTNYYVSGFAQRDNAIQRGSYYNKQSLQGNLGQTIGSKLTLQANNNFIHTLTDRGVSGNDNSPIISPGDIFSTTPSFFDLKSGARNPYIGEGTNPFQTATVTKEPEDVYRYIGNVSATWTAYTSQRQTFDITALGGIDAFTDHGKVNSPSIAYYESADGQPGTLVNSDVTSQYANLNLSGVHRLTMSPFTATTSFGLRREFRNSDQLWNQARTVPAGAQNIRLGLNQSNTETRFQVKDLAYFAQEELLMFNERLLLTGAVNAERSSVNGDDKKFYAYPKFAASYRVPFLPPHTDEVKLRFAFGRAGNQPGFGAKYTTLPVSPYSGQLGGLISSIAGNPDIKPETSNETEGGIDVQLFSGRMSVSATLFRDRITDLILNAAVAPSTGFSSKTINGGAMFKTGTELELQATPIQTKALTWTSHTTFSNYNSRVTRLDVPCSNGGSFFSVRYGASWICQGNSITSVQVNHAGFDTTFSSTGAFVSRVRKTQLFESAPDFQMGFQNDFTVGRFRLGGLLDWRKGGYTVNLTNNYWDGTNLLADTATSQARLAAFSTGAGVYLEKATFLKLREINLSYGIPTSVARRVFGSSAQDVRLEFAGRNLYTWAPYTGYDPEVSNFGNQNIGRFQDVTPYPPSRSFFFAISANF